MSKEQATPAPWKMTEWFGGGPGFARIRRLQPPPGHGTIVTFREDEGPASEADARLIEAAPELLNLLKEAQQYLGCSCDRPSKPPCGSCVTTKKIDVLVKRIEGKPKREKKS